MVLSFGIGSLIVWNSSAILIYFPRIFWFLFTTYIFTCLFWYFCNGTRLLRKNLYPNTLFLFYSTVNFKVHLCLGRDHILKMKLKFHPIYSKCRSKKVIDYGKMWNNSKDHSLYALDVITKNLQNQNLIPLQAMFKLIKLTNQKEGLITCTQLSQIQLN